MEYGVRSTSSSETPGGGVKRKCCRRVAKNMKSSALAKVAPGHNLRPERDSSSDNVCKFTIQLKLPLSSETCRKCHEGITLQEVSIFVQEVGRMKALWFLPFILIMEDRCQERKHHGSLKTQLHIFNSFYNYRP